jgi:ribosomal protein L40E
MDKYNNIKKWICIPIFSIFVGELLMLYDMAIASMVLSMIGLLAIIVLIIFGDLSSETKDILRCMMLLPILRITNLSTPQILNVHIQYILIYGVMLIPTYSVIKNICHTTYCMRCGTKNGNDDIFCAKCGLSLRSELEANFGKFYIHLLIIILTVASIVMIVQYMDMVSNEKMTQLKYQPVYGDLATIFLIILLSISLLLSGTKYWNKYVSDTIGTCSNPMLLTFVSMVIYKFMSMVK